MDRKFSCFWHPLGNTGIGTCTDNIKLFKQCTPGKEKSGMVPSPLTWNNDLTRVSWMCRLLGSIRIQIPNNIEASCRMMQPFKFFRESISKSKNIAGSVL